MKLSVRYTAKVLLLLLMLYSRSIANFGARDCSMHGNATVRIGVVVDQQTRVGKEEEIAMKIAVQDLRRSSCLKLTLHFRDTYQSSTAVATSSGKKQGNPCFSCLFFRVKFLIVTICISHWGKKNETKRIVVKGGSMANVCRI